MTWDYAPFVAALYLCDGVLSRRCFCACGVAAGLLFLNFLFLHLLENFHFNLLEQLSHHPSSSWPLAFTRQSLNPDVVAVLVVVPFV